MKDENNQEGKTEGGGVDSDINRELKQKEEGVKEEKKRKKKEEKKKENNDDETAGEKTEKA